MVILDAVLVVIILDGGLYSLFGEHRAVQLVRRKSVKLIDDLLYAGGFELMWHVVSNTAEFGGLTRRDRVITEESKKGMQSILDDIHDGTFKNEWRADYDAGLKRLHEMEADEKALQLEAVGKEIRSLFQRKN